MSNHAMYNYLCYWYIFVAFYINFYLLTPIIRTLYMVVMIPSCFEAKMAPQGKKNFGEP